MLLAAEHTYFYRRVSLKKHLYLYCVEDICRLYVSRVADIASIDNERFVYLGHFFLVHLIKKKKSTAQDVNDDVMI